MKSFISIYFSLLLALFFQENIEPSVRTDNDVDQEGKPVSYTHLPIDLYQYTQRREKGWLLPWRNNWRVRRKLRWLLIQYYIPCNRLLLTFDIPPVGQKDSLIFDTMHPLQSLIGLSRNFWTVKRTPQVDIMRCQ